MQSFWALGALAEVALASKILVPWGWRWLLGSASLPFGERLFSFFCSQTRHTRFMQQADDAPHYAGTALLCTNRNFVSNTTQNSTALPQKAATQRWQAQDTAIGTLCTSFPPLKCTPPCSRAAAALPAATGVAALAAGGRPP